MGTVVPRALHRPLLRLLLAAHALPLSPIIIHNGFGGVLGTARRGVCGGGLRMRYSRQQTHLPAGLETLGPPGPVLVDGTRRREIHLLRTSTPKARVRRHVRLRLRALRVASMLTKT